jgi:hypothetical protein
MLTQWKLIFLDCKTSLEFGTNRNISHQVFAFEKTCLGSPQNTLTIIERKHGFLEGQFN